MVRQSGPSVVAEGPKEIVIIGGSGLIGTKLVKNLRQVGHEVVVASAPHLGQGVP